MKQTAGGAVDSVDTCDVTDYRFETMSRAAQIVGDTMRKDRSVMASLAVAREMSDADVMVFAKLRHLAAQAGSFLAIPFSALSVSEWEAAERLNDLGALGT